jgi:hypothetical protein
MAVEGIVEGMTILRTMGVCLCWGWAALAGAQARQAGAGATFTVAATDLPGTLTVIEYGDMRFTDPSNRSVANPAARRLLVARIATEHPDAVQLSGDVPYAGSNVGDYTVYTAETAVWREQKLRIYPALGNHEFAGFTSRERALENWWNAFPALRGLRWYSVALGARVYLINLDSNSDLTAGSEQRKWVEGQIAHLGGEVDFVFVSLHHPPVADVQTHFAVDHNPRPNEISLREYLSKVGTKSHARFVVTGGHIHNYERFEKDGVVYLVSGGGGAQPYPVERTEDDKYQAMDFPNFHYVKFTLEGKDLKGEMFRLADPAAERAEWQLRDSFVIAAK